MRHVTALGVCAAMLLPACAPTANLEPAPQAQAVAGPGEGAVAEEAGVRVVARLDAWRGEPADLATRVTPLFVEIDNRSGRPLLLGYGNFQLIRSDGGGFAPLPPASVRGTVVRPADAPGAGLATAGQRTPYGAGSRPDLGALSYDPLYIDRSYAAMQRIELPTRDMLQLALGEGTVEAPGRQTGFLYFEPLGRDTKQAVFQADLVDARTGQRFGTVRIPFQAERKR